MILQTFFYPSDHFRSGFSNLSIEEENFEMPAEVKLYSKNLKYLEKIRVAEFGTPFA
jgi:hypothetical protein